MKRLVYSTVGLALFAIVLSAGVMDDNGRAGVTGAPSELTCNQTNCHNSYTINSGTGSVRATSTMNNWAYVPGTTYTINVTVKRIGTPVFGIGAGILKPNGDNAGTLIVTNTTRTSIKTRLVGAYTRRNIVHTLNGGRMNDSCVFSFNWTAPSTDIGPVTMYVAGNCANGTGSAAGDYIYTMNQVINSDASVSIGNMIQTSNAVNVFPNPASEMLNVSFDNKTSGNIAIHLTDLKGSNAAELFNGFASAGTFEQQFQLPALPAGIYLLNVDGTESRLSRRVVIR